MARRKRSTAAVYRTWPTVTHSSESAIAATITVALALPWVTGVSEAAVLLSPDSTRWQVRIPVTTAGKGS